LRHLKLHRNAFAGEYLPSSSNLNCVLQMAIGGVSTSTWLTEHRTFRPPRLYVLGSQGGKEKYSALSPQASRGS